MTILAEAQNALDAAQQRHAECASTANLAASRANALRAQVATGDGASVTATDLATADDEATHAALVAVGAEAPLAGLTAAVAKARSDEQCDSVVSTLPLLGDRLVAALDTIAQALAEYVVAADTFDAYAADAFTTLTLSTTGPSSRVAVPRYGGHASVDGISLHQSNADRLLSSVVAPALAQLGAPAFAFKEAALLASAALQPPTTH